MTNKHVGRNDPCPCGSGKKFKTCCMQKRKAVGGQSLGIRKFTAKVISSGGHPPADQAKPAGPPKAVVDYAKLMERSYGDVFEGAEELPPLPESDSDFVADKKNEK